jgi:hypothetical protein
MIFGLLTIIWIILGLVTFLPSMMAPMALDAPGSANNPFGVTMVISMMTFPVVAILSPCIAWLIYYFGFHKLSNWLIYLPFIHIFVFLICAGMFFEKTPNSNSANKKID